MKPNFTSTLLSVLLVVITNIVGAQTLDLSKTVDNITTGTPGNMAAQTHILEYTINVRNLSTQNLTVSKMMDNIPAGSAYVAGSTSLNGISVADISGSMPFTGSGGTIQSPGATSGVLRPNVTAVIKFRVRVTANGGNIRNSAIVESLYQSNSVVQNTNTVFTNLSADPTCSMVYQSTSSTVDGFPQAPSNRPYRYIKLLNTANGTASSTIYNGATGLCFNAVTGASLSAGSVLLYASAIAYDKATNRIYFVNNNSAAPEDLCFVDLNTTPVVAKRFIGYPVETITGSGYNVNRMSFASDGFGYAITENGRDIIRFSMNSSGLPIITRMGALLNAPSNGTMDILNEKGGDIFGDGSGNLYLVANSSNLYKINPNTKVATFLGSVNPFPGTSNSIAVDASGNVYIGGAYQNVYTVNLATMGASSITGGSTTNVWTNGDYTSCAFPVLAPALTANKTYSNINGRPFVVGGDTIEYRIEVSNTGNINAAGVKLYDGIPMSTNYIAGSTKVNGVTIPDVAGAMPFSIAGGRLINSTGQQPGIIKPGAANSVVMTFRARIDPLHYVCNQSRITLLDDNGNTMFINSDDPSQNGGQNPTCFYSDGVLPASHITLKGTIYHEQSNLAWTVTTDQEVSRYEVEFSEDGYTFINAGTVAARNDGSYENRYAYADNNNKSATRFYRLKLIGINGLYTYSQVIRLTTSTRPVVNVLPNPFIRDLKIDLQLKTSDKVTIRLADFQGRTIVENKQSLTKGNHTVKLEVPGRTGNGIYIIEVFSGNEKILNQKLIKQ
ncbi:T9SS type A sorting domain-containing protein [Flavitalea sp.]|nr:T9SS type A sorting domain-containing protein [Flavitalea sp.]